MSNDTRAVGAYTSYENLAKWLKESATLQGVVGYDGIDITSDDSAVMVCIPSKDGPDAEVLISVEDGEISVELIWSERRCVGGVECYVPRSMTRYIDLDTEPTVREVAEAIEALIVP